MDRPLNTTSGARIYISRIWERFVPHFCKPGKTTGRVVGIPDPGMRIAIGRSEMIALPAVAVWLVGRLGGWSWERVVEITISPPFWVAAFGSVLVWWWHRKCSNRAPTTGFDGRYGAVDRWLHHAAFASTPVQVALAEEFPTFLTLVAYPRLG